MVGAYFSPIAPAAVLLLGAFILLIVMPRLPERWLARRGLYYFMAPVLVTLAILATFGLRFTPDGASGAESLTAWRFAPTDPVYSLAVQATASSLIFILLTLLLTLVAALLTLPLSLTLADLKAGQVTAEEIQDWQLLAVWLLVGAAACFLFVSATPLTMGTAVFLFDGLLAFHWMQRRGDGLAVARLGLGALTAATLAATAVSPATPLTGLLVGFALWLRLGLYPFIEAAALPARDDDTWAYLGFSLTVGSYLLLAASQTALPAPIIWLITLTLLLNGLLTLLAESRRRMLIHFVLVTLLLMPAVLPLAPPILVAYSLATILGMTALWFTPLLGPIKNNQLIKAWPYIPALAATLTLIGLPFTLGWLPRLAINQAAFLTNNILLVLLIILAEILAFSGLARYWLVTWRAAGERNQRTALGFVVTIPFLIPGLSLFVLSTMMIDLPPLDLTQTAIPLLLTVVIIAAGGVTGLYRENLLERTGYSVADLTDFVRLRWLIPPLQRWLDAAGKWALRVNVVIEGQNYVGWAIFTAIVGTLIILLRT